MVLFEKLDKLKERMSYVHDLEEMQRQAQEDYQRRVDLYCDQGFSVAESMRKVNKENEDEEPKQELKDKLMRFGMHFLPSLLSLPLIFIPGLGMGAALVLTIIFPKLPSEEQTDLENKTRQKGIEEAQRKFQEELKAQQSLKDSASPSMLRLVEAQDPLAASLAKHKQYLAQLEERAKAKPPKPPKKKKSRGSEEIPI
jgi:hypothetical protein